MLESRFQADLIKDIKAMLPGSVVLKNDPNYLQGFPDLLILHGRKWAALECKASVKARHQPNQDYYVEYLDNLSFAAFIDPENREDILNALSEALRTGRKARLPIR